MIIADSAVADLQTNVTAAVAESALRRVDLDAKQELVAQLLRDCHCEGLLILHPANFRWLTAGANAPGLVGRDELPALYFSTNHRWLLACSTDAQRFFDEDLDSLGFQQKEWHWTMSREQFLADLVFGRRIACDQPFRECKHVGVYISTERRKMTGFEASQYAQLGAMVAHAVEATARNLEQGTSEEEIAGHVAHRLYRHGVEPMAMQIASDGASKLHRRRGLSSKTVERWCTIQATGRKFGLHATVARTIHFGPMPQLLRQQFDLAMRLQTIHLRLAELGASITKTFDTTKAVLKGTAYEHDWRAAPPFTLTGREPAEGIFHPNTQDHWLNGWVAVWQERIGAAAVVDTYALNETGWHSLTPPTEWPIRRAAYQGHSFEFAEVLIP